MEGRDGSVPSVKPDYEWKIDGKRKMWVYLQDDGVTMILVDGRARHYQNQEPDIIINALFEKQLEQSVKIVDLENQIKELKGELRPQKAKKISLFHRNKE